MCISKFMNLISFFYICNKFHQIILLKTVFKNSTNIFTCLICMNHIIRPTTFGKFHMKITTIFTHSCLYNISY